MEQGEYTGIDLITSVQPMPDKKLKIELCTGSVLILNMANRLHTVRFCPLKDEKVFRSVTTDGYYLRFDVHPNYELDFTLREAVLMSFNNPPDTYEGFNPFDKAEQKAKINRG